MRWLVWSPSDCSSAQLGRDRGRRAGFMRQVEDKYFEATKEVRFPVRPNVLRRQSRTWLPILDEKMVKPIQIRKRSVLSHDHGTPSFSRDR